jgi:hypothetical protein
VRRRKNLPRIARLSINLLLGEYPPSRLSEVTGHGDRRFLMILRVFDSLIKPYHVCSGKPALIDRYQISNLNKRPL